MRFGIEIRLFLIIACLAVLISGCATSQGSYKLTSLPPGETKLAGYSDLFVEVTCAEGIPLSTTDLDRLKYLIVRNVPSECSGKFKCIDRVAPDASAIRAKVNITRYDEGNAFARWMLAGLGQMHIDADVALIDYSTGDQILRSEVSKTFAWGGMYGASTGIHNIEDGFAKAVAASFTGKNKNP